MTYRNYLFPSILAIALTGCATTKGQPDTAQTAAPASASAAAPNTASVTPLTTPAGSAKRIVLNMTGPRPTAKQEPCCESTSTTTAWSGSAHASFLAS